MIAIDDIARPDQAIRSALIHKIDNLTKPKGSLGRLEEIALQIGLIQQSLTPTLTCPQNILFAADHGIADEGVSLSPKTVTWQQMLNFVRGGAGINFLCRQHRFILKLVDAGVDYDFSPTDGILDCKVRKGSRNFLYESALTDEELELCLTRGADVIDFCKEEGTNVLSLGEMGIGNTSPSAVWMHLLTDIPLVQCIGAGSGLDKAGICHKYEVLQQAVERYAGDVSPLSVMKYFGGLEMVMTVGAMLQAARHQMLILVDGFIMSACMLAASRLCPAVLDYAIFAHCGDEAGHRLLLDAMGVRPLLQLGLRLGEGTGAVLVYPIVESAVRMINEMDTFAHADIIKYF